MFFRYSKHELVELLKPATVVSAGNRVTFGDQPQLRSILNYENIFIKRIDVYSSAIFSGSPYTSGATVANAAALQKATLTLNIAGYEWIHLVPLLRLNPFTADPAAFVPGVLNDPFMTADLYRVDWTKSYIQFNTAPAATLESYLFGIYYDYKPGFGLQIAPGQNVRLDQ